MREFILAIVFISMMSYNVKETKTIGTVERINPALDAIIDEKAQVEILAEGFKWSEGPVWIAAHNMLLFSDVPNNIIHKWTADKGVEPYLTPSGYTGTGYYSKEPGSNGLTLSIDGKLVMCQHGDRKVALMDAPLNSPQAKFITLADNFQGMRLNSPNDAVFNSKGDLFFTDPPYGLPTQSDDDPTKQIPHNGVYKMSQGKITLIADSLTRPNGIALLPDERTILVANSDPEKAAWYAFDLLENDSIGNARVFYDATSLTKTEKGLPDGLKVDKQGNIFATGPGGIWIFNKKGDVLGKIKMTQPTSNCALTDNDSTLYITANMYLARVKLKGNE